MNSKDISIVDIAEKAQVSTATVSRVLNHPEQVKSATSKKVKEAMAELNYSFADSLAEIPKNNKGLIIIDIPSHENPFYSEIIKGAQTSATAHGYHLLTNQKHLNANTVDSFCNLLKFVKALGVITLNCVDDQTLHKISSKFPVVQCCEYNPDSGLSYVGINDISAACNAMEYILSTGRQKIAMINGPLRYKYARDRRDGYERTLEAAGIELPKKWIIQLPEVNYEMAYSAACQLLNSEFRPNAFFVVSDVFAAAVIRAAKRHGLHVPRDIVVVGFDNVDIAIMSNPSITTISQPKFQLGYTACELLVEKLSHPDVASQSMLLDTELIIRESTSIDNTF